MSIMTLRETNRPSEQVEDLLANISDGFIALDNEWRFTHLNAAAERMLQRKADQVIGRTVFNTLDLDPDDPFQLGYLESKQSGEPVAFSAYSKRYGVWFEVRGHPHSGGYTVFCRDVTEERRAHRALLESKRKLETVRALNQRIFETSVDLILVVDRQGNIAEISPSARAILGYRSEEMVGRSAADFLYPADLESTKSEMRTARRGRQVRNFETRYVHKDGRVVPLSWTGVWAEAEHQYIFIGRDMTERLAAEERLRRSQRLEVVGQLTGGIAHDFNNLLTVVIGSLDLQKGQLGGHPEAVELSEIALQAAVRGAELTRQLLAFAGWQQLDAKVININEQVSATMVLLRRTLGEQIVVETDLDHQLWFALADPGQLEAAIMNLALNARDAMGGRGKLFIETSNKVIDEHYVEKNLDAAPGEYVVVSVSDTGTGMSPEVLARVFEPFFTTKPIGKGTGLGLSMVYGFAKQSNGHVQIYSEVGHGTSVRLYLPRAAAGLAPSQDTKPEVLPLAKGGEKILVVEDNLQVRKVVISLLHELSYQVIEAADGESALQILEQGREVDLLFTDIVMSGGMTGHELARAARRLRPWLKVLLTSGFAKPLLERGQQGTEFGPVLSKPYRKIDLATKIRAGLDAEP
jgi:PAS domain S-box-containing protein